MASETMFASVKYAGENDFGENIQGRDGLRVAHQGQLNKLLNRAAPSWDQDPLVFPSPYLFSSDVATIQCLDCRR